jgi:tryptophan-rich sensory protein
MKAAQRQAVGLVAFLGICFAASAVGGLFTASSVGSWYQELARPSWNPPDWVFAPVWTTLYAMMGIAAWLVWRGDTRPRRLALFLFGMQLALNVLWSALFFGLRNPAAGLVEIVVLFFAIAATAVVFARCSRLAALLLLPYLLWVGFASFLNAAIWHLN